MQNLKIILTLIILSSQAYSAEVDHYTASNKEIVNALDILNQRANKYIGRAITRTNVVSENCNRESLYKSLKLYFANHSKGQFSKDLLYDQSIPKTVIPLEESIYKDWSIWNGYLLGKDSAKDSPLALGPVVRLDNQIIGTDKFEHLFGMGFNYFDRYYNKGKALKSILKYGVFLEKTILGGNSIATGVFSYADLSANFNGMRFWNHMLQEHDDVLGAKYNEGPYIQCVDNKWVQVIELDFSNYIDLSMDESINCSKFATKSATRKIRKLLKSQSQLCLSPKNKSNLLDKYKVSLPRDRKGRSIYDFIINEDGHEKVSYFNEF